MKKEYRNVSRSKKLIRDAVITLLEKKKDITSINVTDVIKTADINRGTFYNHYDNINDVINEIEDELMEKLISTLELSLKKNNSLQTFIFTITDYLSQNEKQYKTIAPYVPKYILDDMKNKFLKEMQNYFFLSNNSINNKVLFEIVANGVAGTYMDYLE